MVQYQREYDDLCEKRLQEELERFKSTEVALVRAEERKRFQRELDSLRATLQQEYRDKQERLQERERDLELAFVAKRTELETSLFETRQSLFKDMERLRVKEAELQVKVESDFRHFATETQRFQLWEENVRTQEANLESLVSKAMREKERTWQIERQQALQAIQDKQDELSDRERALATETGTLKGLKTQVSSLQQEVAALEAALSKSSDELRVAQNAAIQLDKEKQRLEEKLVELHAQTDQRSERQASADTTNARLAAEKALLADDVARYRQKLADSKEQGKGFAAEIKALQQQVLDMKLDEANAIVTERKKFVKMMDEEREQFQWKENELLVKTREMQSRLAETEAQAEKFQSQYEDEKVHVEALRHDVASLNSLLTQAQATINAKHAAPREISSFRLQRPGNDLDSSDFQRGGNERTFMMKMMEMMANFQDAGALQRSNQQASAHAVSNDNVPVTQSVIRPGVTAVLPPQVDPEQEEIKRLKEDQERIERELIEQREFERKKQARMEEQERELAEQHKQFEARLALMRQQRIEEEERLEEQRRQRVADEEAKLQEDLARQRAALQEAAALQQTLAEQREAHEQQRLQEERAYQERRLAEERKFNEEIEAKRQQQQLEDELAAKRKQEREEEERRRQEREVVEEQERKELEAVEAAQKEEEERYRVEEEQKGKQVADEELQRLDVAEEMICAEERAGSSDLEAINDSVAEANGTSNVEEIDAASSEAEDSDGLEETNDNVDVKDDDELYDETSTSDGINTVEVEDTVTESIPTVPETRAKTPEEEEQERQQAAEEVKRKEDEDAIDVYRQRVLARKAAEKQRQMEQEAANAEEKAREEEQQRLQQWGDASESDHELELSGGSFAESSAASNSDSF